MKMIQDVAARRSEATAKKQLGVEHWVHDKNWLDSLILGGSRYERSIDYSKPLRPPLEVAEELWLEKQLRKRKSER